MLLQGRGKRLVSDRTDTRTEKEGTKEEGEKETKAGSEGWADTDLEEMELQNFLVEDYADLHIGEPFQIENYYITNLSLVGSYFSLMRKERYGAVGITAVVS